MIDIDHIFNLFNAEEDIDVNKFIYIHIFRKFTKIITKNKEFSKGLFNSKDDLLSDVDPSVLVKVGEYYLFNRAFDLIKDFNEDWIESLELCCDLYLAISLKLSIAFFELHEEYEKCAILQNIFNKISEILGSSKEN